MGNKKRTPSEWERLTGIRIIGRNGWRHPTFKDWDEPIDRDEWERRMIVSTCEPCGYFAAKPGGKEASDGK